MPWKTDAKNPADWLVYAEGDLTAARVLVDPQAGFHTSRSKLVENLEKVLKAELIPLGTELQKTQDLNRPYDLLLDHESMLAASAEPLCDALVQVDFTDRYPGFDLADPDWPKLRHRVAGVAALLERVRNRMSTSSLPSP